MRREEGCENTIAITGDPEFECVKHLAEIEKLV
jgi:hypothetical protein